MAIPDYQTIMLPLLKFLTDGNEHSTRESIEHISNLYNLSDEEKTKLLPSGQQPIIDNRVGWARTYLKKAGLLDNIRRGYIKITKKGLDILKQNITRIDIKFLEQFPEFVEFRTIKREQNLELRNLIQTDNIEEVTPDELIENGVNSINASLAQELLDRLKKNSPSFFELVVLKLLSAMGYGKGEVTGRAGDGGIDGFVNQDRLGLDKIYFQAKRFAENNPVSASMLRDFVGSLELNRVNKGVFITTSKFPSNANELVNRSHKSIILIDGNKVTQLMIENNVGVATEKTYNIKRIDSDFFPED